MTQLQHQPPPSRPARKWPWVFGGFVAFLIALSAINGGQNADTSTSTALTTTPGTAPTSPFGSLSTTSRPEDDVTFSKCNTTGNAIGMADIAVRITNSTNRVQSYWVTVSVNDAAGNRLTEANGASNAIRPGQSANAGLLASGVDGAASCAVANVTRIPQ